MSDVWHACGNCGGRFPCEASDARDATIADIRRDLVIARGRVEELTANLARVLAETDAHLTTAYADRDRFNDAATDLRAQVEARDVAVREYLAAESMASDARLALGEMSLIHDTPDAIRAADDALTTASLRLISARKAIRKIVEVTP